MTVIQYVAMAGGFNEPPKQHDVLQPRNGG